MGGANDNDGPGPSDAGAIAGAPDAPVDGTCSSCSAPPQPAGPPPPSCKVEVRANKLSDLGYYHMFIVFTDATGKEYYLRGGPSAGGPGSSGLSSQLGGGSSQEPSGSNASNSSDGGGAGGSWGYIVTEYGEYKPGTIDWDPGAKSTTVDSGPATCGKLSALQNAFDGITASKTPYNPLGPNSNSSVFSALRRVGISPAAPAGVWAPGANIPISIK
jgi:hypothetical protein